jgi:hypothetical protein
LPLVINPKAVLALLKLTLITSAWAVIVLMMDTPIRQVRMLFIRLMVFILYFDVLGYGSHFIFFRPLDALAVFIGLVKPSRKAGLQW